jgi:acetylglutamate kinase
MSSFHEKAQILTEALPYIRTFFGKTIVIKYGGAAMTDLALKRQFAADVVLMKYVGMHPVIVHGGGPQISEMMKKLGHEPRFVNGIRVTNAATMEIVEMVLSGRINKEIVALIHQAGGRSVGLTGKDGALIQARPVAGVGDDMGHAGEVERVDPLVLKTLANGDGHFIPVISPIGASLEGESYNINADVAAGAIASAIGASRLLILTDVSGISDASGALIPSLSRADAKALIQSSVISKGMVPKVEAALSAVEAGVQKAHIIDGRVPHALLLEMFTDHGVGTEIIA